MVSEHFWEPPQIPARRGKRSKSGKVAKLGFQKKTCEKTRKQRRTSRSATGGADRTARVTTPRRPAAVPGGAEFSCSQGHRRPCPARRRLPMFLNRVRSTNPASRRRRSARMKSGRTLPSSPEVPMFRKCIWLVPGLALVFLGVGFMAGQDQAVTQGQPAKGPDREADKRAIDKLIQQSIQAYNNRDAAAVV